MYQLLFQQEIESQLLLHEELHILLTGLHNMATEVIFPTWIADWTPASDDRILFSDTSASNQTKDCAISDLPISTSTQSALDAKLDDSQLDTDVSLTANSDSKIASQKATKTYVDSSFSVVQSDINAHEARSDNPHSVTKAQVGLSNVDNTSDASKPISTATQAALNTKVDDVIAWTNTTVQRNWNTITVNSTWGGGWGSGNEGSFAHEVQTATASQTVFNISFDYVLGNNLYVFVNGQKQIYTEDYNETDTNTVTFVSGLNSGDIVEFIYPNKWVNYKWTYNGATAYLKDDAVYYDGSSYIAIQDTTWNLPTNATYWGLFVSNGGNMYQATYDPQGIEADAFDRENHTGTQTASTISDFTEVAQDVIWATMTDSAEIDFSYDDTLWQVVADLKPSWVWPWTYTNANVTVDSKGRVTTITSGSSWSGGVVSATNEVPTGTINGSNKVFTISNSATNNEIVVTLNWVKQKETTDYTLSGTTLTFVDAPFVWALLEVYYVNSTSSAGYQVSTKSTDYTLVSTDYVILADTTSNNVTLTLPTAVNNSGRTFVCKKVSYNHSMIIATTSSQTIDWDLTQTITSGSKWAISVHSDGSNWYII